MQAGWPDRERLEARGLVCNCDYQPGVREVLVVGTRKTDDITFVLCASCNGIVLERRIPPTDVRTWLLDRIQVELDRLQASQDATRSRLDLLEAAEPRPIPDRVCLRDEPHLRLLEAG